MGGSRKARIEQAVTIEKYRKMVTYFNRKDLVSFGSYLLSEKRKSRISELNQNNVTHADIENWKYEQENKKPGKD